MAVFILMTKVSFWRQCLIISLAIEWIWIHLMYLVHVHLSNEYLIIHFWPSYTEATTTEKKILRKKSCRKFFCLSWESTHTPGDILLHFGGNGRENAVVERTKQKRTKVEYISIYLRELNMDYRDIVVYSMTKERHSHTQCSNKQNVKYVVRKVKTLKAAEAAATAEQHFYGCTCYNVSKRLIRKCLYDAASAILAAITVHGTRCRI